MLDEFKILFERFEEFFDKLRLFLFNNPLIIGFIWLFIRLFCFLLEFVMELLLFILEEGVFKPAINY